jgi:hypothetical protein
MLSNAHSTLYLYKVQFVGGMAREWRDTNHEHMSMFFMLACFCRSLQAHSRVSSTDPYTRSAGAKEPVGIESSIHRCTFEHYSIYCFPVIDDDLL